MAYFRNLWGLPDPDEAQLPFAGGGIFGGGLAPVSDPDLPFAALGRVMPLPLHPSEWPLFGSLASHTLFAGNDPVPMPVDTPELGDAAGDQIAQVQPRNPASGQAAPPSDEDVQLLGRLIYAEGADHWHVPGAMEGIGSVVRNRIGAPGFPKTLSDVIYQPGRGGKPQFRGVNTLRWDETADPSTLNPIARKAYSRALEVARGVLDGTVSDPTRGAIFFSSGPHKPGGVSIGEFRFRQHQ